MRIAQNDQFQRTTPALLQAASLTSAASRPRRHKHQQAEEKGGSISAAAIAVVTVNTVTSQAGASRAPGVDRMSESNAVGTMRTTSERIANGVRNRLMATTTPTPMKTMTTQTNEQTVVNTGETEVLRDRLRHQGLHRPHPQPLADRVPQLPMAQVKRMPSATHCCMDHRQVNNHLTQCILQV